MDISYPCDGDPYCLEDGEYLTDFGLACAEHRGRARAEVLGGYERFIRESTATGSA
jgi:hypothetical protein